MQLLGLQKPLGLYYQEAQVPLTGWKGLIEDLWVISGVSSDETEGLQLLPPSPFPPGPEVSFVLCHQFLTFALQHPYQKLKHCGNQPWDF